MSHKKHLLVIIAFGLCLIGLLPAILNLEALHPLFNFSNSGQIGDTIGGITGPFLNLLGIVFVYFAYMEQLEANKIQKDQFKLTLIDSKVNYLKQVSPLGDDVVQRKLEEFRELMRNEQLNYKLVLANISSVNFLSAYFKDLFMDIQSIQDKDLQEKILSNTSFLYYTLFSNQITAFTLELDKYTISDYSDLKYFCIMIRDNLKSIDSAIQEARSPKIQ